MLLALRSGIAALAAGRIPQPPRSERLSLMEVAIDQYSERVPLEKALRLHKGLSFLKARSRAQRLSLPTVRRLVPEAHELLANIHPDWCSAAEAINVEARELLSWCVGVNVMAIARWGVPFIVLMRIAKDGPEAMATVALCQAITVEKAVLYLPSVQQRVERARAENDQRFMVKVGRAFAAVPVPQKFKKGALDFFLAAFDPWLADLSLKQQADLLREGGLEISEHALRCRKSRLGLAKVDRTAPVEFPPELAPLIRAAQARLQTGFRREP
jgi:hypothetical protein